MACEGVGELGRVPRAEDVSDQERRGQGPVGWTSLAVSAAGRPRRRSSTHQGRVE